MNTISRPEQSKIFDQVNSEINKKAFCCFDRISFGTKKEDPFRDVALPNVWKIKGKQLLRSKKES